MPIQQKSLLGKKRARGAESSSAQRTPPPPTADQGGEKRRREDEGEVQSLVRQETPAIELSPVSIEKEGGLKDGLGGADEAGSSGGADIFRPIFVCGDRPMSTHDDWFESPEAAMGVGRALLKPEDEDREMAKRAPDLKMECWQNLLKGSLQAIFLDNKRLQAYNSLKEDKKAVEKQLAVKRGEVNAKDLEIKGLTEKRDQLQKVIDSQKNLAEEKEKLSSDLEAAKSEIEKLKSELQGVPDKLDAAKQEGYDFCFDQLKKELEEGRDIVFQAGYDLGLDQAKVPADSDLRCKVLCPKDLFEEDVDQTNENILVPTENAAAAITEQVQDQVQDP